MKFDENQMTGKKPAQSTRPLTFSVPTFSTLSSPLTFFPYSLCTHSYSRYTHSQKLGFFLSHSILVLFFTIFAVNLGFLFISGLQPGSISSIRIRVLIWGFIRVQFFEFKVTDSLYFLIFAPPFIYTTCLMICLSDIMSSTICLSLVCDDLLSLCMACFSFRFLPVSLCIQPIGCTFEVCFCACVAVYIDVQPLFRFKFCFDVKGINCELRLLVDFQFQGAVQF